MQLMSGTQSEETTVEVVEEKSGSFRMLPALPSTGTEESQITLTDSNNTCVFYCFFVLQELDGHNLNVLFEHATCFIVGIITKKLEI